MITFRLKQAEFSRQIEQVIRTTGREASDVVRQEGKLLVQDLVKLTPPFGPSPNSESFSAQRKVGEKAVERDLTRTFTAIDPDKIHNPKIRERIKALTRKGDVQAIQDLLKQCRIPAAGVILEMTTAQHQARRDGRGRVKRGKRLWIVRERSFGRFLREKKKHVGQSKAGWAAAAAALGLKLPAWITRHGTGGGSFVETKGNMPKIRIENRQGGGGSDLRIVERALKNRIRNIGKKLEKIARSGWKKKA